MKVQLSITDMTSEGRGVGRTEEGQVAMVNGAVKGDVVLAELDTSGKRKPVLFGKVTEIVQPSPDRIPHPCPHHSSGCRGSLLGIYDYDAGLKWKQDHLRQTLQRIGRLENPNIAQIIPSSQQWAYRDRLELQLVKTENGFRPAYTGEDTVPVDNCLLGTIPVQTVLQNLSKTQLVLESTKDATPESAPRILLRDNGKGACVALVFLFEILSEQDIGQIADWLAKAEIPGYEIRQARSVKSRFYHSTIVRRHHNTRISFILSEREVLLKPTVFTQANRFMSQTMVDSVLQQIPEKHSVIDLYGGFGMFGAAHAMRGGKSTVVESSEDAIKTGQMFSNLHSLFVAFVKVDLSRSIPGFLKEQRVDTVILDPPRSGITENVMKWLNQRKSGRLIYVSCHPAALARDLKGLKAFQPVSFQPLDMFPNTPDLETIAVLERK